MHSPVLCVETIELDSCLDVCYNTFVYQYHFKHGEATQLFSITHIEMWSLLLAFKIWGHQWTKKSATIKCGNQAVVGVVNTSVTKDNILATMTKNLWLETVTLDIKWKLVRIPGTDNGCAGLLSRWHTVAINVEKLNTYISNPLWCNVTEQHLCLNLEI